MLLRLLSPLLISLLLSPFLLAAELSYSRDVQPILTQKCVACHACYDSPCQLNLGSGEGVARGASKQSVYDGTRSKAQQTTRLYLDAHGAEAWQSLGFHAVTSPQEGQAALMSRMLSLGRSQPLVANEKLPADVQIGINRSNQCPLPGEFDDYAARVAHGGMPFAVAGLSDDEYMTLQNWLAQGAKVDQQAPVLAPELIEQITQWESLLNADSQRERLVGRWLYEHLFLAHLYFQGSEPGLFFELVRSRTAPGQPVDPIATRRPNDDPGTTFFYRLRPIQGVIVHKTHITYPLSPQKLARVRELFFADDWQVVQLPGYGVQRRANPFETFAAIPARARYQFMLDNAEYFVRTFIRGPVCRGQIATDVIRDQFWTLFQAPEHDLYVTDAEYRAQVTPLLSMPGQLDEIGDLLGLWRAYRNKRNAYETLRLEAYREQAATPDWSSIWTGNDNAFLSIFRQHDSASVRKGFIGAVPQTLWWMDYPLLERTYYQLVVNFDVFGNVSHQAQTRLYFDLIRNGAEQNFLRLMPEPTRQPMLDDWYQKGGKLKMWLDYAHLDYRGPGLPGLSLDRPKHDLLAGLLARHGELDAHPDPINRCHQARCHRPDLPFELRHAEQSLSRLAARPAAGLKVIDWMPEVSMLRVVTRDGKREVYSLLRNRAHSNVAFMLGESLRYQPGLDTLTVYPGVLSSYPNFMFSLAAEDVPVFVGQMEQVRDQAGFDAIVRRWGIRRSHPAFWEHFHDLARHIAETEPVEAGVLDMNRYENL